MPVSILDDSSFVVEVDNGYKAAKAAHRSPELTCFGMFRSQISRCDVQSLF